MTNAKARRRARAAIVEFGLRMQVERLGYWTSGNLSMRVPGDPDLIVVSPSATPWDLVEPEDVPLVRLDGTVARRDGRPTSELPLHTLLYQRRPEIAAVVHVHSPAAMAMAALDWTLPAFLTGLVEATGGAVACAPYARPGSAPSSPTRSRARSRAAARASCATTGCSPSGATPPARIPGRGRHRGRRGRVPARARRRQRDGPPDPAEVALDRRGVGRPVDGRADRRPAADPRPPAPLPLRCERRCNPRRRAR